jgi:ribosomal protein L37AE/L43A
MTVPLCPLCGDAMIQRGRYANWTCACCDESVACPHVSRFKRLMRRLGGRRV